MDIATATDNRDASLAQLLKAAEAWNKRESQRGASALLRALAATASEFAKRFDAWDRLGNRDDTEQGGVARPTR